MASKRIKGITIEIDGNTTKLSKSLEESEKKAKKATDSLRDIEKALKFNPGNTNLVEQQQRNLQVALDETKEKLKILKDADQDVKKQFNQGKLSIEEYEAFQREIVDTENSLERYKKRLQESKTEQENLSTSTSNISKLLEAQGKTIDDVSYIVGDKLASQYKKGEGSSRDMEQALLKLGDEFLGTGQDADKLNDYLSKLDDGVSFDNLQMDSQKVSDGLDDITDSANDTSNALEQMVAGDVLSGIADKAQAIVDKFIDIANQAREYALEQDDNYVKLQTNLSLTRDEAESLGEVVDDVMAGGVVESSSEATDAVVLVKKAFTDLNDTDLAGVTDKLLTLSTRTGTDMKDNVNASKILMREFGMTSSEAFDYLAAGYQNGLNYSDDFVDTIREYAPLFSDANLSADEFMNILYTGMENGALNTDKAADAIKELQIRLGDGSFENNLSSFSTNTKTVFEYWKQGKTTITDVMGSIQEDLKKMNPAEQQAALSMLSTQFEDLGIDASIALLGIESNMRSVTGKADLMNQKTVGENWRGTLQRLKDLLEPLGTTFQNIAQGALTIFVNGLEKLFNWFNGLSPVLQSIITALGVFMGVFVALIPIVTSAIGIFTALKGISSVLGIGIGALTGPIGIAMAAIAALVAIGVVLYKNWDTIKIYAASIWEGIKGVFTSVVTAIGTFLSTAWEGIKNTFVTVFGVIKSLVTTYFNVYKTIITTVFNVIKTVISTIWNTIKTVITSVVTAIKTVITTYFNIYKTIITTIFNAIKTIVTTVWEGIKTGITTVVNAIKTVIQTVFNSVKTTISTVFNSIKTTITTIWNTIKSTITTIITGIKTTISNVFNSVKSTVSSIFNGIKAAIKSPMDSAANLVRDAINRIKGFFNFKFTWPKIPLPHFKMSGSLNPLSGNFPPKISVNWYKEGGIFENPSIIGVGEAGREAVLPTHKLDKFLEDAVKRISPEKGGAGGVTIHIDKVEVREESDIEKIARELFRLIKRNERGLSNG